jgi:hypothetical protein
MPEQSLIVTPEVLQRLSVLRSQSKFANETLYPRTPTEEVRLNAERVVNAMLDRLAIGLTKSPRKSYVISEFLEMLKAFERADTEEREQACTYCERVMGILGIANSDGALNTWLYGFDPEQRP